MAKMMIKEVARMTIGILKKGDSVLNVTPEFIAVQRKNGEVDIVPLLKDETLIVKEIEFFHYLSESRRSKNQRALQM